MKGNFVINFLTELASVAKDIGVGWSRIPYKGVRYSDFNVYGYKTRKRYVGFKNLERRGIIKNKDKDRFVFTKKGRSWLDKSLARYFKVKTGGKWDQKWRLVIFDIPEKMHKERVKFRKKIKSLGFEMIQKSVFIFPYSCEEEIADVAGKLRVSDYVDVIIAQSAGFREKELVKIFGL